MANYFDLSGRTALVTGAARGLGKAIALGLAGQGANVAVVDRLEEGAQATAREIEALGVKAMSFALDVSEEKQVQMMVAGVLAYFGQIDILVNNAGITKRLALFDWKQADWEEVIRINQIGTFLMARAVGRHMISRKKGSIINISALGGGVMGLGRGNAIYCATKGAILALTRDLAAEWAQHNIRVNALAPGWFETDMNAPLLKNEEMVRRIQDRVPLGRFGKPEDVVGPAIFLASDASAMITGVQIPIDGGVSGIVSLTNEAVVR